MYILQIKIIVLVLILKTNVIFFSEEMQLDIDMQWIAKILFSKT